MRSILIALLVVLALAALVIWPQMDLAVSGWVYRPEDGFFLRDVPVFEAVHVTAYAGSRIVGFVLLLMLILSAAQRRAVFGLEAKGWLFLLLGLLIGPVLVANEIFKDHWGRARPREVIEFGGNLHFSRALVPVSECVRNCSFVNGDGSFGFYLPIFAYMVPPQLTRRYFWGGMGLGLMFAFVRVAVGAHFLSDAVFAAFFMQLVFAFLHGAMFGWDQTRRRWRTWLFFHEKSTA